MDLRQLKYFIVVTEAGSFSKAALQCNVVQSALSQQIASLEDELGRTLLVRSSKGVSLSHAGETFIQHAKRILQQVEHARSVMSVLDNEPTGAVTIGFPTSTAASLSIPFLQACLEKYPKIELRLMEGLSRQVHQSLNNGSVDVAVLFSGQPTHGLKTQPLLTEELFLIKKTPPNRRPGQVGVMSARDLADQQLLLPERGNGLRDLIDSLLQSLGIEHKPTVELGSLSTMLEAVKRDFGATILPWGAFAHEEKTGIVSAYRIEGLCIPRTLMLCTSGTLPISDPATAVITLIQELVHSRVSQGLLKHVYLLNPRNHAPSSATPLRLTRRVI